jgi:nucleoside phosphorylase
MDTQADVLIVTVTKVESQAVMEAFAEAAGQKPRPQRIGDRVYHDLGEITSARVFMALSEMGTGGVGASQQAVQKGIEALNPDAVIMVGIAFGVNEQKQAIGDILVACQLMLYDLQRIGKGQILPRGDRPHAPPRLVNCLRSADLYWEGAPVHFGLILTGEKLVDDVDYRDQLKQFEPEAIGGEMEGAGLYVACQDAKVDWILVKAICDWADGHKSQDKEARQKLAAQNAAAFVLHALQHVPLTRSNGPDRLDSQPSGIDCLRQEFVAASQGLLHWPRTIGDNPPIERPELQQLLGRFQESEYSTTLILGGPGTGKSALLATLGFHLIDEGVCFLAIKADMLGRDLRTFEDLQCNELHLSIDTCEAIRTLAKQERIVLLVDQLDAVSDLLDRHSGRLNILLNLIHTLSRIPHVHIVATSREFEFRHDVRLSTIDADSMKLELPTWEQLVPLLAQSGHDPSIMNEPLRELLRTPLHLKLFLDIAEPGTVFESLQALFEKLWEQRVVDPEGSRDRLTLLEQLARRMAEEETLWVPTAAADEYPEERRALEQAEILTRDPTGRTLGFRHQSYYDYTLARAFARGTVSLADHVLQRQDGLFVRPTLLNGLHYLRDTARSQYHQQLQRLMESELRSHIRALLLEFLGELKDPDQTEASILLPIINSQEGPRVLRVVTGSPGWFTYLRHHSGLAQWMHKPPEEAIYCLPLLRAAAHFDCEHVLRLLGECWLNNPTYDALSLSVIGDFTTWSSRALATVERLVRRTSWDWTSLLIDRMAESNPALAPRVLRAEVDRRLQQVLAEIPQPEPALPPDADEQQRILHDLANRDRQFVPLNRLIENEEAWCDLDILAQEAPKAFLDWIWPWFLDIIHRTADDEHSFVIGYRKDHVAYRSFEDTSLPLPPMISALLAAVTTFAKQAPEGFWNFAQENSRSELMTVHRLLARGLEHLVAREPGQVLEYLLGDPRRLVIGDLWDNYQETKRLIVAVCQHLAPASWMRLEEAVLAFTPYKRLLLEWSAEERFQHLKWARQDRLRLLRAFPQDCLSLKAKRLRAEEERALSETLNEDSRVVEGEVGPRLTADELSRASDDSILRLVNELPDKTEWRNPNRRWSKDFSRSGGAVQLSREFGTLAKQVPMRVAHLIRHLEPQQHEYYVGAALAGLGETDFPTADLIHLIETLDQQGFTSGSFRNRAANALEKRARQEKGLHDTILANLERWLADHPEPTLSTEQDERSGRTEQREGSVLFSDGSFILPHGRGDILLAIAAGYLARECPDLDNWARVIESRLQQERHPAVWGITLRQMCMLFNGDLERATHLYDAVIRVCPEVLRYTFALQPIARIIGCCQPKEQAQDWLESLLTDNSTVCHQAHGELLVLYHSHYQDAWSESRIRQHLAHTSDVPVLRGLAYAASYLWRNQACQPMATTILRTLAASEERSVQKAVASVFRVNQEGFTLNPSMRQLIEVVRAAPSVLRDAALYLVEALEPYTGTESELVSQVCQDVLKAGGRIITNPTSQLALLAATLTNIALTLHRQGAYREVGLALFEQLLSLNVPEASYALNLLDRRPVQARAPLPRRSRRRRR